MIRKILGKDVLLFCHESRTKFTMRNQTSDIQIASSDALPLSHRNSMVSETWDYGDVRTLESFFAQNRSQSESEKNDTEEEQCINQEETNEDRRKPKKSRTFLKTWLRDHTWLRYEKEAMFCYFCRKSKKTNPFATAEGCTNFRTSTLQQLFSTALDVWARTNWRISTFMFTSD